jgi:hypothetical protein
VPLRFARLTKRRCGPLTLIQNLACFLSGVLNSVLSGAVKANGGVTTSPLVTIDFPIVIYIYLSLRVKE